MYTVSKDKKGAYVLLSGIIASHLGWVFEMILFIFLYGGVADRGFVTLPLCPIYGITAVVIYYLIGTPQKGGALIGDVPFGGARFVLYFALAVIIPSVAELVGGEVMEMLTGEVLWSYEHIGYNVGKYISLPISLGWGALIFTVMLLYERALSGLGRVPYSVARRLSLSISALILLDFVGNLIIYAI